MWYFIIIALIITLIVGGISESFIPKNYNKNSIPPLGIRTLGYIIVGGSWFVLIPLAGIVGVGAVLGFFIRWIGIQIRKHNKWIN